MGFSGGGSNVTRAHTHDSTVVQDGGALAANVTQFGLSNQSMLVSDGSNIQELAVGSEGDNLGVTGGALTWAVHSIATDEIVMANSTTLGDYTQPGAAVATSSTGTETTTANNETGGVNSASNIFVYVGKVTGLTAGATIKSVQVNCSSTDGANWRCGYYDDNSGVPNNLLEDIGEVGALSTGFNTGVANETQVVPSDGIVWVAVQYSTSSAELVTRSPNTGGYSDANAYASGLPNPFSSGGLDKAVDVKITTVVGDQPASNAVDDNTATYWESNSETNPAIYVDMSSSTTTSNLAVYPNTLTTETEIKIQSSTNASDWTDKRTITYSNLTEAAWNYIRFNLTTARYWRIYGNSGGAEVLAIDEIKVLDAVSDTDVRTLHGHRPISSSDTSLNNAGV